MMMRNFLRCRGCGSPFIARVAAGSTDVTKFYVPCPHCHLPIRARATGQDLDSHNLWFDCDELAPDVPDDTPVVTINPYVPARYDADYDEPVGGFSAITLHHLLGDEAIFEYFAVEEQAQSAIDDVWPTVHRLYEYYLAEDWVNFDRVGSAFFDEWPNVSTVHQRATLAHHAVGRVAALINGELSEAVQKFFGGYLRKHAAALEQSAYLARLRSDRTDGTLAALQRAIFDLMGLFVMRFEMWKTGRMLRWVQPARFDNLTLFRDEFPEMRDLYQQAFELISKTLRYPIAAQNTMKRSDPDDFGDIHPEAPLVPVGKRPSNLAKFQKLPNAYKAAYIALVPQWTDMAALLENKVRNTIGHASVRHDLRTGRIVSDEDPDGLSYLEFLAKVLDMFELLCVALQVVRTARVASSPDFSDAI